MSDLPVICYTIAIGFVAAGLVASLHQLVTASPPSFRAIPQGLAAKLWTVLLLVIGGPAILMRNAIRGRIIERRSTAWLAASTALATSWSFVVGSSLLALTLAIAGRFAA